MFLYEKKIVYLSHYVEGARKASAGFARVSGERDGCMLDIHIKNVAGMADGDYALFLVLQNRELQWGTVTARSGSVRAGRRIPLRRGMIFIDGEEVKEEELCGVLVHLDGRQQIAGYWKQPAVRHNFSQEPPAMETETKAEKETKIHGATKTQKETEIHKAVEVSMAEEKKGEPEAGLMEPYREDQFWGKEKVPGQAGMVADNTLEDKWQQLQRCYRIVHPFGDGRTFLAIEPKDFIILHSSCQRLVNNSFLLHGFYNYRHLILGPDKEMGDRYRTCYYLGVPGTYFEREKMVAVMFGFEGFECSGAVEIGKFGYYMRRVEL